MADSVKPPDQVDPAYFQKNTVRRMRNPIDCHVNSTLMDYT